MDETPMWTDPDFASMMERTRMDLWRRTSPMSNLHSMTCPPDCYNPRHYPPGSPAPDDDDMTANQREVFG